MNVDENPGSIKNAHLAASLAEHFIEAGNLEEAIKSYYKAADFYRKAILETTDSETIRTLKLLSASNEKQAKQLEMKSKNKLLKGVVDDSLPSQSISIESEGGKIEDRDLLSDDPFLKFWDNVENLVQTRMQPVGVALTSAPLTVQSIQMADRKESGSNQQNNPILHLLQESYFEIPEGLQESVLFKKNESQISKSIEEYKMENEFLKNLVDQMSFKIQEMKKIAEENHLLKSSIIQFRDDFSKTNSSQLFKSQQTIHNLETEIKKLQEENRVLRKQ